MVLPVGCACDVRAWGAARGPVSCGGGPEVRHAARAARAAVARKPRDTARRRRSTATAPRVRWEMEQGDGRGPACGREAHRGRRPGHPERLEQQRGPQGRREQQQRGRLGIGEQGRGQQRQQVGEQTEGEHAGRTQQERGRGGRRPQRRHRHAPVAVQQPLGRSHAHGQHDHGVRLPAALQQHQCPGGQAEQAVRQRAQQPGPGAVRDGYGREGAPQGPAGRGDRAEQRQQAVLPAARCPAPTTAAPPPRRSTG